MSAIEVARAVLSLEAQVPNRVFTRHLPCSPLVVGEELAVAVDTWVREQSVGYYPALEFFQGRDILDPDLLDTAEQISWFVCGLVREEVSTKLRGVFSSVHIDAIQTLAFTLPSVRPSQHDAIDVLAQHYCPDTVKISVRVSMFQRTGKNMEVARWASHLVNRWLRESFESLEITGTNAIT